MLFSRQLMYLKHGPNQFGKDFWTIILNKFIVKKKYSINDLLIIHYLEHIRNRDTDATIYHWVPHLPIYLPNQQEVMDSKVIYSKGCYINLNRDFGDRRLDQKIPSLLIFR